MNMMIRVPSALQCIIFLIIANFALVMGETNIFISDDDDGRHTKNPDDKDSSNAPYLLSSREASSAPTLVPSYKPCNQASFMPVPFYVRTAKRPERLSNRASASASAWLLRSV